jgi:hypothetical protein
MAISSGVIELCVFSFGPLVAKPRIRLDRNLVCDFSGTYVQSFGSIAPAVTKRDVLTDKDDGRRMPRDRIDSPGEPKSASKSHLPGQDCSRTASSCPNNMLSSSDHFHSSG